jgi:hypothetical protein
MSFAKRYRDLASEDDDIDWFTTFGDQCATSAESLVDQKYGISNGGCTELIHFAGDERVGLFVSKRAPRITPSVMIKLLTEQLRSGNIDPDKLAGHIVHLPADDVCGWSCRSEHQLFFDSLNAVKKLSELYSEWAEATVSIEITKRSIGLALWNNYHDLGRYEADTSTQFLAMKRRAEKFACIAMMETGDHDLHPVDLQFVVALASGNSIYVAEALLQDPSIPDRSRDPEFVGIRRILGNLDRPGVVMLVPPKSSLIREPDLKSWKLVQQADFNGILSDSFKQTSLHLSFTDFEVPIAIKSGAVDAEVVLLEALVSVHDRRQWIADFHDAAASGRYREPFIVTGCSNTCEGPPNKELGQALFQDLGRKLKSINNWDELLCSQDNLLRDEIGVVQTHNNWTSRLAASVICNRKRIPSTVLPSQPTCAECNKKIIDCISWKASCGSSVIIV